MMASSTFALDRGNLCEMSLTSMRWRLYWTLDTGQVQKGRRLKASASSGIARASCLDTMPLKAVIVGAGLGGLAAAIAFTRAGHDVEVSLPR